MLVVQAQNAHLMLPEACRAVLTMGVVEPSRNGKVLTVPMPVALLYRNPRERVLFHPERDANPFLHFFESLWMLAGRNDAAYMTRLAQNFAAYSDDGTTFNGAYGFRWREHFAHDQLTLIVQQLRADPSSRRVVLSMWDGHHDPAAAEGGSRDVPCNTHIYFRIVGGLLNMTVCNRSNDLIWGACGANVVHMSYLQEYLAARIGCEVGQYWQISNNLHVYEPHWPLMKKMDLLTSERVANPYTVVRPYDSLMRNTARWEAELVAFLDNGNKPPMGCKEPFFTRVAAPLAEAHRAYKQGDYGYAIGLAERCTAEDWSRAAVEWLERRAAARRAKLDAGARHE